MASRTAIALAAASALLSFVALAPAQPRQPKPGNADAVEINGFVSIDVSTFWDHPVLAPVREANGKLEFAWAVQSLIGLAPGEIDRLTLFWSESSRMSPLLLVRSRKPVDPANVVRTLSRPGAAGPKTPGDKVLVAPGAEFAFVVPVDDRTLILGHRSIDPGRLRHADTLAIAVSSLAGKKPLTIVVDQKVIQAVDAGLNAAGAIRLEAALGKESATLTLTASFPDAAGARAAEPVLRVRFRGLAGRARAEEKKAEERVGVRNAYAAPLLALAAAALESAKVRTDGKDLVATTEVELDDLVSSVLAALPDSAFVAGGNLVAENNMKQIMLAMHNYESTMGRMPSNSYSKDGKPLLSWRVHILPYIEQATLYSQFKLDEPWDSPHNKPLGETVVKVFQVPGHPAPKPWMTYFRSFIGPKDVKSENRPFLVEGKGEGASIATITDGTSNTILVAEAADAVPWSKPDDLVYDGVKPLPKLGGPNGRYIVGLGDGSVRTFRRGQLTEMTLRSLITLQGGEVVSLPDR